MTLIFITLRHYYTRRAAGVPSHAYRWLNDACGGTFLARPLVTFRPDIAVWRIPVGLGCPHVPVGRPQVSVTPRERPVVCAAARRRDATVLLDSSIAAMETLDARRACNADSSRAGLRRIGVSASAAAARFAGEGFAGVACADPTREPGPRRAAVAAVAAACADAATAANASDARPCATLLVSLTELRALGWASRSSRHSAMVELLMRVGDASLRAGDRRGGVGERSRGTER